MNNELENIIDEIDYTTFTLPADAHLEQEANYEVTEDLIAFGV